MPIIIELRHQEFLRYTIENFNKELNNEILFFLLQNIHDNFG